MPVFSFVYKQAKMNKSIKTQFVETGPTNNQKQIIQGILTSRIETRDKTNPFYYAFGKSPNLTDSEAEFPIIFKNQAGYYKPNLTKDSQIELTGTWSSGKERPSFTCSEYKVIKEPEPLTVQALQIQLQKLLASAWEHRKDWTKITEFLQRKKDQLHELEKYQKHPHLLKAYLALKSFYYSNEYKEKLEINKPTFLNKVEEEAMAILTILTDKSII